MTQQRQHAAVKMEIRLHFERNYFVETMQETGTDINYNIRHARKQPELLAQ